MRYTSRYALTFAVLCTLILPATALAVVQDAQGFASQQDQAATQEQVAQPANQATQPSPAQPPAKEETTPPQESQQQPPAQPPAMAQPKPPETPQPTPGGEKSEIIAREPTPEEIARLMQQIAAAKQGERLTVGDICTVKQPKEQILSGFGLAVQLDQLVPQGLSSRVVAPVPTEQETKPIQLADLLQLLNQPLDVNNPPNGIAQQLWEEGKLRLVWVSAPLPPQGVTKGEWLECEVRSFDNRSLDGCYLLPTKLYLGTAEEGAAVAIASGPIMSQGTYTQTGAKLPGGCLVQTDVPEQFVTDGKFILVLDDKYADFRTAQEIADAINLQLAGLDAQASAKALGRYQVEVQVPSQFVDNPVLFINLVLQQPTSIPKQAEAQEESLP